MTGCNRRLGPALAQALVADKGEPKKSTLRAAIPMRQRARLSEHIPLRRYGEPEEFGRAAALPALPRHVPPSGAMIAVDWRRYGLHLSPGQAAQTNPALRLPAADYAPDDKKYQDRY